MKNNIDKIVKTDTKQHLIPQGHEARFLEKLKQREADSKPKELKLPKRKILTIIMGVAAMVLIMITFFNPKNIMQSEVECDEVCEFISYSDSSIYSLQSELIATATARLLPEELIELKDDLIAMTEDYNYSKKQQGTMTEEEFLGFIYNVYQQQVQGINNIFSVIN